MKLKVTEQATGKVWFINPAPNILGWSFEDKVERAIFDKLSYQGGCHKRDYHGAIWLYTLAN